MQGKTIVITGGTSGIGLVAASELAAMGARIVLLARDRSRAEGTLSVLRSRNPNARHSVHYADLSLVEAVKSVAAEIAAAEPVIDVLINNAGAIFHRRQVTAEGLERTFATNHMSYFVLTAGLRDSLLAAPAARIVNTSSSAHRRGPMDFADLQSERGYRAFGAYGRSKLANILFTRELARRLEGTRAVTYSLHPGFVATRFGNHSGSWFGWTIRLAKLFAISEEKGARTIVHLASARDVGGASGDFFSRNRPEETTSHGKNMADAARLWEASEQLAAIRW